MKKFLFAALLLSGVEALVSAAPIEFNRDIRPILSDACSHCHGPDKAKRKGNLRLDTEEGAKADLGDYHAIVPGDPAKSVLLQRLTSTDKSKRMPPHNSGRKVTDQQIEILRRWIAEGAKWQPHWSLVTPVRPSLPELKNKAWVRNPIDAFILARLEKEGLAPSAEADRTTLLRRVTLDLTGLPPTPAEVDTFLADSSPDAYEKVVDRLLASPRYGERMVLDWLDAARYADSNGYQNDGTRTMWPWRDWVIDAFNKNMPFNQFTVEQIAGDLLPNASLSQKLATGFNRNHMLNGEGGRIAEESRVDYVADRVETAGTVWLGLTIGCARCHDHKYDPLTQKDFYQLFAYFNSVAESGAVDRGGNASPVMPLPSADQTARIGELTKSLAALDQQLKATTDRLRKESKHAQRLALASLLRLQGPAVALVGIPDDVVSPERQALSKKQADLRGALDATNKSIVQVMVMEDRPQPRESFVLVRGAWDKPGEKVKPGVPAVLPPLPKDAPPNRLAFARWLVDPAQPLTARVTVNRWWQMFFGGGLVKTVEDFGTQGEWPSHPELLDWLAVKFAGEPRASATGAWDAKALHRLLVTSATYRQSSKVTAELRERDPDNRLLARGPRHRLNAFTLRDQALAAGGLLVEKIGGPPVKPYQPPGIWEEMSFGKIAYKQDKGESLYRRSLYTFWRRTVGPTTMFDASARQVCTVRQTRTNTPLHSLILLNDPTYVEAARALAERVLTLAESTDARLDLLFRLATARKPADAERPILRQALERLQKQYQADPAAAKKLVAVGEAPRSGKMDVAELAAWTGLASVVLNLDEVLCKE